MNIYKIYGNLKRAKNSYKERAGKSPASVCIQCGQCEGACPQKLPIIELLRETADTLEE